MSPKVAVVGTTGWGTTLGIMLARKGLDVVLWARTEAEAAQINRDSQNKAHLPSVMFPENLWVTASAGEALDEAELTVLGVPAQAMRANLGLIRDHLWEKTLLLSLAKGIEIETTMRMSEVITEELPSVFADRIAILSGPNFAQEVVQSLPTATVVASANLEVASAIQRIISSSNFRAYTNADVIGVELGGALKNVVALAVGMSDGLGYGDNTRAALITRGLMEIARLGVAAGANPLTFSGLAGMGDLVATCTSQLSRNRFVGQELAKGRELEEVLSSMSGIAEGVDTTVAALELAGKLGVEMPIATQVYRVLFEGIEVRQAVRALMERELKHELNID
ncbi:MAG: NAD(P)-dependent glycerol-3-phosphate dehydrogenase [Dehalococcoidia bacterium]|nr:NAD(P)-dependent glycerol-3-phosphate dehydrogenase [Dehalococcoidia bacterium]